MPPSKTRYSFPSFGKINWRLEILGQRPDGFHELVTVLQTIDWGDQIDLEWLPGETLELETRGRPLPGGAQNLAVRAGLLLQAETGVRQGARIRLHKHLPVGGGMGGGSSNAATTLLFLNQLWDCRLTREDLRELAAGLGSDVPFFFEGGLAAGSGRGDKLSPMPDAPPETILLLIPPFSISTAEAYQLGGWSPLQGPPWLTSKRLDNTILRFRDEVERGDSVRDLAENDFDRPLLKRFPRLAQARQQMLEAGCEKVMVSGSGSTLLGLASPGRLAAAAGRLSGTALGEVRVCRTLPRGPYWKALEKSGLQTDSL